uniref:Uncharacterized protein n=1 Tax=Rhizophora mucronata TaxID=61149 RepID=A0A2P2QWE2_RHIMU
MTWKISQFTLIQT